MPSWPGSLPRSFRAPVTPPIQTTLGARSATSGTGRIKEVHETNYGVCGVRKVPAGLARQGGVAAVRLPAVRLPA